VDGVGLVEGAGVGAVGAAVKGVGVALALEDVFEGTGEIALSFGVHGEGGALAALAAQR
jgi:hypothetical protein